MYHKEDIVIPIRMDGRDAIEYLYNNDIVPNLIYLDMDHEYEAVKGDLEQINKYYPKTMCLLMRMIKTQYLSQLILE